LNDEKLKKGREIIRKGALFEVENKVEDRHKPEWFHGELTYADPRNK